MTTEALDLQSTPPPELGFGTGDRFPDLILPDIETGQEASLFELGGDQVLVHLFASW